MVKKKSGKKSESFNINKIVFGHETIDKKDMIEIAIIIVFTIFLSFMHIKTRSGI